MSVDIPESSLDEESTVSLDRSLRDENRRGQRGAGQQIVSAGSPITEARSSENGILLLSGKHGGFRLEKLGTRLAGAPGSIVANTGIVESNCILQDLVFARKPSSNNETYLLRISSTAKVLIKNCIFERLPHDKSSTGASDEESFILIEDGGKAIIAECVFRAASETGAMDTASGHVVKHLGSTATNVYVGLGFNLTSQSHYGVTAITPELT